eukprot:6407858-Amphidinium_carterae.1
MTPRQTPQVILARLTLRPQRLTPNEEIVGVIFISCQDKRSEEVLTRALIPATCARLLAVARLQRRPLRSAPTTQVVQELAEAC